MTNSLPTTFPLPDGYVEMRHGDTVVGQNPLANQLTSYSLPNQITFQIRQMACEIHVRAGSVKQLVKHWPGRSLQRYLLNLVF